MTAQVEKNLIDKDSIPAPQRATVQSLLAAGGLFGALASTSCCIVPLLLFSLGVSGAWIGNLTALAPYQPIFLVVALACLGAGFVKVYRQPKIACTNGSYCASPVSRRVIKTALWSATLLIAASLAFTYAAPWLLDI